MEAKIYKFCPHCQFNKFGESCLYWPASVTPCLRGEKSGVEAQNVEFSSEGLSNQLLVPLLQEIPNGGVSRVQRGLIWQEDDAEVMRARLLPKPGAVHHEHVLLTEQFLHEDVVALRDVQSRIGIKRSSRRDTTNALCVVAPLHGYITAAAQLTGDFRQVILRAFQRRLDGILLRMVGT
jgi:hypothetical protein